MARVKARCCWCKGQFVRIGNFYWCSTEACRIRQANYSIVVRKDTDGDPDNRQFIFLFVPLPKQVEFEECVARNLLGGGAAGSTKSHICRWRMYRRALKIRDYEGLLIRRTWGELEKHHFRLMEREAKIFRDYGIPCEFQITRREMTFHETNAVIEGGHMESQDDIDKYLSRERDDISVDEGVTIPPQNLLELSTRARTTKPAVLADGGARFSVYTNPGGIAASMLRDFFINHEPQWEDYSAELKEEYNPLDWHYIPGNLEDNPYLPASYQSDLAVLQPWRFQQLRYNDWDVVAGTFFAQFSTSTHVKDLGDPGENVEWFESLDWGYIQPGVVLWWALLPDGVLYIRKELKYSHMLIENLVDRVMEIRAELGIRRENLRYSVADPALQGPNITKTTSQGVITGETMDETFRKAGMPLVMGKNDRHQGWQRVHELLGSRGKIKDEQTGVETDLGPHIIIHPSCRYLTRCLSSITSAKNDPEDVDTTADDHPADATRYGAMSRPSARKGSVVVSQSSFMGRRAAMIKARNQMGRRPAGRYR